MKLLSLLFLITFYLLIACCGKDLKPDTRKISEITQEDLAPQLTIFQSISLRLAKDVNDKRTYHDESVFIEDIIPSTEFPKLFALKDPTVQEVQDAFKSLTLIRMVRNLHGDTLNKKFGELSSFQQSNYDYMLHEIILQNGTVYYPTDRHVYTLQKYASAVIPFYIILGLFSLLAYLFKNKIFHHKQRLIKFSNVSKVIARFLAFKLMFDISYLFYLTIFSTFHVLGSKIYFIFFLVVDQIIDIGVFHGTIAIFVQGYLTLHYDKKVLYNKKAILLTFIYLISVFAVKVYAKVTSFEIFWDTEEHYVFNFRNRNLHLDFFMCAYTIVLRIIIILIIIWEFSKRYKESNHSDKFLLSFTLIAASCLLSAYVKVPIFFNLNEFWTGHLKVVLIGDGDLSLQTDTTTIPEIFLVGTGSLLIFIWREKNYKELDQEQEFEMQ